VLLQNPDSESARKKAEADRLRAAEKFMVIGSGTAECKGCGYEYTPEKGDPDFPVAKGTLFQVGEGERGNSRRGAGKGAAARAGLVPSGNHPAAARQPVHGALSQMAGTAPVQSDHATLPS
jgi:hypothetical protein